MNILLDTHVLLWALEGDERLSPQARRLICDEGNGVFYSVVSLWEVQIKHMTHPDKMKTDADDLARLCNAAGYEPLAVLSRHVSQLGTLRRRPEAPEHKDPFDRMLVCQAKSDGHLFLTHDARMVDYDEPCVMMV